MSGCLATDPISLTRLKSLDRVKRNLCLTHLPAAFQAIDRSINMQKNGNYHRVFLVWLLRETVSL